MPKTTLIRTTAFRVGDDLLGSVWAIRPGPRFVSAWSELSRTRTRTDDGRARELPYRGLAAALTVLSRSYVAVQKELAENPAFVVSRNKIEIENLATVVRAWELHGLKREDRPLTSRLDDLRIEHIRVASLVHRREGTCPTLRGGRWPWQVAKWEIAERMTKLPLLVDGSPVALRVDSDANLLSWQDLVCRRGREQLFRAMHVITPTIITVPGVSSPVVSFQSRLVRLAPSWDALYGPRYAWVELASALPILRAAVRKLPEQDEYVPRWIDLSTEILRSVSLDVVPSAADPLVFDGPVRAGYSKTPRSHPIGRGVGSWLHEYVSRHARAALGENATPLALASRRSLWPTRSTAAPRAAAFSVKRAPQRRLRVIVAYASEPIRKRLLEALVDVLGYEAPAPDAKALRAFARKLRKLDDGRIAKLRHIEVVFVRPPQAERVLLERGSARKIADWTRNHLSSRKSSRAGVCSAVLVETRLSAREGDAELADPKGVIRHQLGKDGLVTQFITAESAPATRAARDDDGFRDHAARNAVSDLMRGAGFFLRPFPNTDLPKDTLVVAIYGTRLKARARGEAARYVVNMVATALGTHRAWGFAVGKGWLPLGEATANFMCREHAHSEYEARKIAESAVEKLRLLRKNAMIILMLDACGCRRFWKSLQDTSGLPPEPWMTAGGKAVVRIRTAANEVLRPGGSGEWGERPDAARHTDFRPMSLCDADGVGATYVVSGSAVLSQGKSARKSTRFAASEYAVGEDWHSLGTTEILPMSTGPWTADEVVDAVAMLCRVAPTWDRVLRWPSPLHLARAAVRDHPRDYDVEDPEEDDGPGEPY